MISGSNLKVPPMRRIRGAARRNLLQSSIVSGISLCCFCSKSAAANPSKVVFLMSKIPVFSKAHLSHSTDLLRITAALRFRQGRCVISRKYAMRIGQSCGSWNRKHGSAGGGKAGQFRKGGSLRQKGHAI
jgi:hypothetical protein